MPCYHPVKAWKTANEGVVFAELARHDIVGQIELPCRQCIGCRLDKGLEWTIRIEHEAQLHGAYNSFVTLTYAKPPPDNSLCYRDVQLAYKRLRKVVGPFRHFTCGEYGDRGGRPHYHAILFGIRFPDLAKWKQDDSYVYTSPILEQAWGHGHVTVSNVSTARMRYVAQYALKKVTGDLADAHYSWTDDQGVVHRRTPEFGRMSLRPGIGAAWLDRYESDIHPRDYVVHQGHANPVPSYYRRKLADKHGDDYQAIAEARAARAKTPKSLAERTPERLAVREVVAKAQLNQTKRKL